MSELSHVARPYAKAIFDLAKEQGDFSEWSGQLKLLSLIASDKSFKALQGNPAISKDQMVELMTGVAGDDLTELGQNLVKLLVRNDRALAISEIGAQYKALKDEAEQVIEAELITASQIGDEQKQAIAKALSTRLGKKVKLEASVDEDLIGGAVVRAGDWVVDGSVRAQLSSLVSAIGH